MAFFSTPVVPWLYSGVTMTTPSNEPILAAHPLVWSFWYRPNEGGNGSSRCGRGESRRAASSKSASTRARGILNTHSATCPPTRLGRVLPRMMPILVIDDSPCSVDRAHELAASSKRTRACYVNQVAWGRDG